MTVEELFRDELSRSGLTYGGPIVIDDKVHRFKGGDDKEPDSWYSLHLVSDGLVVGAYGSWRKNFVNKWSSREKSKMSREDWAAASKTWKDTEAQRAEEERKAQEKARNRCKDAMSRYPKCEGHPYAMVKGIQLYGDARESTDDLTKEWLALPIEDIDGTVHSMQFIAEDGTKRFMPGGRIKGCFIKLAEFPGGPIMICEGYATGCSIYEAFGRTTICALNCGNLMEVAQAFRKKFPDRTIVICADDDRFTDGNPGMTKAEAVVKACKCRLASPEFSDTVEGKPTDFNDLHQIAGIGEVGRQLYDAFPIIARPIGLLELPPQNDPSEIITSRYLCRRGAMLLNGPTGVGKCLGQGTPVLMFDGTVKPVENVIVGDVLMGPDSMPRTVLTTTSGTDEMYQVSQKRRGAYVCNSQHVLTLKMTNGTRGGASGHSDGEMFDIPISDYLRKTKTFKHCAKGIAAAVDWPHRAVPLPPYFLGLWLGDGTRKHTGITNPDPEIIEYIHRFGISMGMKRTTHMKAGCSTVTVTRGRGKTNPVLDQLRALGVADDKHIPLIYRANSELQRLYLLAGLIDSDGHIANGCAEITTKYERLSNDIAFLSRSLGYRCSIAKEFKRCQTGGGGFYYRCVISGDLSRVPMKVARKEGPPRRQKKNCLVSGITVRPIGQGRYFGFELDGDGRFLLGDFTVTHNSSISVQMAAMWSNGLPFFDMKVIAPLRILIVQAEDDDGDVAEMRNGIVTGLRLTEDQRGEFFTKTLIWTERTGATGEKFCKEVLRSLLDLHQPDLVMINPMLSFIGGDVNKQEVVGSFLRGQLNPVIFEYNCACIGFHHTNKPPSGKEKNNWSGGDLAYLGSGSSEWANWARAILSLQSLGKVGYYDLHAAKRGARLGWKDEEGEILFKRTIAWSREPGVIYWREPSQDEVSRVLGDGGGDESSVVPKAFLELIRERSLTRTEWVKSAKEELGIEKSAAYKYIKLLQADDLAFMSDATKRYSIVLSRREQQAAESPEQPELPPQQPELGGAR